MVHPFLKILFAGFLIVTLSAACSCRNPQRQAQETVQQNPSRVGAPVSDRDRPDNVAILKTWSGDYPVDALDQLPNGQQQNRVGYIGDAASFATLWQNLMPNETVATVDFTKNLVVFSRNLVYYNRTNIAKVTLNAGVIEVLAMETMSAMPVEEKAAMAIAVIPRAGVNAIRLDETTTLPID